MAQKPTTTKNLDNDVAKELEQALDLNLTTDGDLDIAASMEDLEAQISQAADELARESTKTTPPPPAAPPAARSQNGARTTAAQRPAAVPAAEPRRPAVPEQAPLQPAGLSPANDDRQKDFRAFRRAI